MITFVIIEHCVFNLRVVLFFNKDLKIDLTICIEIHVKDITIIISKIFFNNIIIFDSFKKFKKIYNIIVGVRKNEGNALKNNID